MKLCRAIAVICGVAILANATTFAQYTEEDMPKWDYDENLSDSDKLGQIERKAKYERAREKNLTAKGMPYHPNRDSLLVNLPSTASRGNSRLKQLNRIQHGASEDARKWIAYEFNRVYSHTSLLIKQGKLGR